MSVYLIRAGETGPVKIGHARIEQLAKAAELGITAQTLMRARDKQAA